MSHSPRERWWSAAPLDRLPWLSPARVVATAGVALVLFAFLATLNEILVVTGEPRDLHVVVAGSLVAGTVLARVIRPRTAAVLGAAGVVGGMYLYVTSLPGGVGFLALLAPMLTDAIGLLSGLSVLRIVNADVWALTAAPAPVFLAWYLAIRRRYVAAGGVAGVALAVVILTGDATTAATLLGVGGVTLAAAFGDCDRRGEQLRNADGVVVVLATMVLLSLFVGIIPGTADSVIAPGGLGDDPATVESSLVYADDHVPVVGPVKLSSSVRFTVEADASAYWRVATYDRYTGDGWVRTGELRPLEGRLPPPPGETRGLDQRVTVAGPLAVLPAANKPTRIRDVPVPVRVSPAGVPRPATVLQAGESYVVHSERPVASPGTLRAAGTDYPAAIVDRYTRLPESTPDRVAERTARLTANAGNPYDTARVLEHWFRNNYEYSLDVERPAGSIADAFLFEMDAGYCTYFATTMVAMLRTRGIPARFVVGYTPGQRVDDDEWVVRGYDSHAWVEVYFPEHGWVRFDPTPPEPRERNERRRLQVARAQNDSDADTDDSLSSDFDRGTPVPPGDATPTDPGPGPNGTATPRAEGPLGGPDADGGNGIPIPSREGIGYGLVALAGLAALGRRTGLDRRLARAMWLRRLETGSPSATVAGAYHRVVHLEERRRGGKRPGETPREFLADADGRARRIGRLYERATYGPGVDAGDAAAATADLAALLDERLRLPHFVRKPDTGSR